MSVKIPVSGVVKDVPRMFAAAGGATKKIVSGFIMVGTVPKKFFSSTLPIAFPALSGADFSLAPTACQAFVGWYNDGTTHYETGPINDNVGPNWLLSGSASAYDIRITQTGGAASPAAGSSALNTWLNMSVSRSIRVDSGGTGIEREISGIYEFALAGTGIPLPGSGGFSVVALMDA